MDNKDLVKFFKKHDYITKVFESEDGCTVTLPSTTTLEGNDDSSICIYQAQRDPLPIGIHYYSTETVNPTFIECPEYSIRILIFQDIMMKTERVGLSPNFIFYYDEDGNELAETTFVDLINTPSSEESIKLEEKLAEIFYATYPDFKKEFLELAETEDVSKGYELVQLAFLMEGF
jgi:hypothetical protein